MGGIASPLGWEMAYDPIVVVVALAVGMARPTYVDDLIGLANGAEQLLRAFTVLLFASHAAGLLVKVHTCRWLRLNSPGHRVLAALALLPVEVEQGPGWCDVKGLMPLLTRNVRLDMGVLWDCSDDLTREAGCRCSVKNAVVPLDYREPWGRALGGTPLEGCVRTSWPCLGVTVASAVIVRSDGGRAQLAAVKKEWWKKAIDEMEPRTRLLGHSHSSASRRAAGWNTYGNSLALYPAHTALPGPAEAALTTRHLSTALIKGRGRWCPLLVYTSLGPLFGIGGAPRCPVATARAVGALAWRRDDV